MLGAGVYVRWRNEGCLREKLSFLSAVSVLAASNAKLLPARGCRGKILASEEILSSGAATSWGFALSLGGVWRRGRPINFKLLPFRLKWFNRFQLYLGALCTLAKTYPRNGH